jgi:hypothetical protein
MNKLLRKMEAAQKAVEDRLSTLWNYGGECHSNHDAETVQFIHSGDFDEIHTFCTGCGGYKV